MIHSYRRGFQIRNNKATTSAPANITFVRSGSFPQDL
jgi:hypothetical protein